MLFDTDVLIWALRGNPKAAAVIDGGARNKAEQKLIKDFLSSLGFQTVPIDENISLRATVFMEEFCLKSGMGLADALIFATACEHTMTLCSANKKHYKEIASLTAKEFRP